MLTQAFPRLCFNSETTVSRRAHLRALHVPSSGYTWSRKQGAGVGRASSSRRTLLTRAYDVGPSEPPLIEQTIPEHFDSIVAQYGDRPAVISHHQHQSVTYDGLQTRSNSIAHGLQSIGVKKGDRVAVSLGSCLEFAVVTYSLFRLGAILVPLNPAFTSHQVISALSHLSASHLIIGAETNLPYKAPRSNTPLLNAIVDDPSSTILSSGAVPSLTHIVVVDNDSRSTSTPETLRSIRALVPFNDLIAHDSSPPRTPILHNTDTVNIQFTSGTTSLPKAAQLTHRSILNNGFSIGSRLNLTARDTICCPPPLFHCFGSILGYMATATHGAAIVFASPAFDPAATLDAVAAHRCTGLYGVPTMFAAELALLASRAVAPDRAAFASLRTGIASGSPVPAQLMRRLQRELNVRELMICYGMTETSPVSTMTTTADPLQKRTDTVGKLLPHVRAKVVDPATGKTLAVGQRGELWVAGYVVMKGYYADEARTRDALVCEVDEDAEGDVATERTWMRTGDEASMDEEGYVNITGRIKDLIIRGGENVSPLEVEDCVLGMEGVVDVSVVGVKDERYGETIAAFVIRTAGGDDAEGGGGEEGGAAATATAAVAATAASSNDAARAVGDQPHGARARVEAHHVRAWVRQRLSGHLVPKHVFFTDSFPKTASGKVQKFALREQAAGLVRDGLGLA